MEQEWKEKKADEAKKARKLYTADNSNKQEELEQKATKPNKGEESSMENLGGSEEVRTLIKPTCDLDRVWEWAEEHIIPNCKTKGAEATKPQKTMCDQTLDPAAVGQNQSSAL